MGRKEERRGGEALRVILRYGRVVKVMMVVVVGWW